MFSPSFSPKECDESQRPTGGNSSNDLSGINGRGLCQNRPVTWVKVWRKQVAKGVDVVDVNRVDDDVDVLFFMMGNYLHCGWDGNS